MKIPVYRPALGTQERDNVLECLDSEWISSKGEFIPRFETAFSSKIGVEHAAATCNGTTALHLALLALGIAQGDEVLVPTLTYVASVNAISYVGAQPAFCDSLPASMQLDPDELRKRLTNRTRAILVPHLYGHACDMEPIMAFARSHGLFVIEDCAEAFGTYYRGKHVGTFGDIATFSFFGNKTITTGEGGMVTTSNAGLHRKVNLFKGQGLSENREYWHEVIGYNYRMTNICAAIGLAQLNRCDELIKRKRDLAHEYLKRLDGPSLRMLSEPTDVVSSFWMVTMILESRSIRDGLRKHLAERGVETRPVFPPVHTMPMYRHLSREQFPAAIELAARGLNLPSWPMMKPEEIDYVCNAVEAYLHPVAAKRTA